MRHNHPVLRNFRTHSKRIEEEENSGTRLLARPGIDLLTTTHGFEAFPIQFKPRQVAFRQASCRTRSPGLLETYVAISKQSVHKRRMCPTFFLPNLFFFLKGVTMPQSAPEFLRGRAARSFRYLLREAEAVTAEESVRFARADWPAHRFGIGQNGSIAGIVYHVAAWKQVTLPLLAQNGPILPIEDFDTRSAPELRDWPGLLRWLKSVGETWNETVLALPDAAFDAPRSWGSETITLTEYIAEMVEHDTQHAAQIEYLRQRLHAE